jgi:uncharacterized protein YwqG
MFQNPKNMFFAAQFNLADFAQYSFRYLLLQSGFLYFFIAADGDNGKVYYEDKPKQALIKDFRILKTANLNGGSRNGQNRSKLSEVVTNPAGLQNRT